MTLPKSDGTEQNRQIEKYYGFAWVRGSIPCNLPGGSVTLPYGAWGTQKFHEKFIVFPLAFSEGMRYYIAVSTQDA